MKWRLLACSSLLLIVPRANAQQPDMKRWLNTGTNEERTQKLVSLGIGRDEAELAVGDEVQWRTVRSESRRKLAVLFAPCGGLESAYLYLLQSGETGWHVTDSKGFDCHYDDSVSIETAPLRGPDADEVLVHHECEDHGTGLLHQDFNVFAVDTSRLRLVLDVQEVVLVSGWPGVPERLQRSAFTLVPTPGLPSQTIEETRCTRLNGKLTIWERSFHWSPASFHFAPSTFVKADPSDAKSEAVCHQLAVPATASEPAHSKN
jgi:hypothetical protein